MCTHGRHVTSSDAQYGFLSVLAMIPVVVACAICGNTLHAAVGRMVCNKHAACSDACAAMAMM
jgi:hypothetical protein